MDINCYAMEESDFCRRKVAAVAQQQLNSEISQDCRVSKLNPIMNKYLLPPHWHKRMANPEIVKANSPSQLSNTGGTSPEGVSPSDIPQQ